MSPQQPEIVRLSLVMLRLLADAMATGAKKLPARDLVNHMGVSEQVFYSVYNFLLHLRYVQGTAGRLESQINITPAGIEYLNQSVQQPVGIQIGAVFNSSVQHSSIQAVGHALHSSIQQNDYSSRVELQEKIGSTIDDLVNEIKSELQMEELASYIALARRAKAEALKETPDKNILRRLLSGLSFLADVEGGISLGERSFELAVRAMPYILALTTYFSSLAK